MKGSLSKSSCDGRESIDNSDRVAKRGCECVPLAAICRARAGTLECSIVTGSDSYFVAAPGFAAKIHVAHP